MRIAPIYRNREPDRRESAEMLASRSLDLIDRAQSAGNTMLDGHAPSAEEKEIADECRLLCGVIERRLQACAPGEIATLLGSYELLFLIAHRRMPDAPLLDRNKRRAIDAWRNGDREVEESDIYSLTACESPYATPDEYTALHLALKEKWLRTLRQYSRFPDTTTLENYERLALIMRENIDPQLKRKCYAANRPADFSRLSAPIIRAYRRFIAALPSSILSPAARDTIDTLLHRQLTTR